MTDVIKAHASGLPAARDIRWNPSPAELRALTSRMPNARQTEFDNYNVQTKVASRSKASTYVVTDRPEEHSDQTMSRADGARIAERIRIKLGTTPWDWRGRSWPLSASFGVAACPETGRRVANLPAQADAALYVAKNSGRNRVERAGK